MRTQIKYDEAISQGMTYKASVRDIRIRVAASGKIEIYGGAQEGKSVEIKLEKSEAAVLGRLLVAAAREGVELQASFEMNQE